MTFDLCGERQSFTSGHRAADGHRRQAAPAALRRREARETVRSWRAICAERFLGPAQPVEHRRQISQRRRVREKGVGRLTAPRFKHNSPLSKRLEAIDPQRCMRLAEERVSDPGVVELHPLTNGVDSVGVSFSRCRASAPRLTGRHERV